MHLIVVDREVFAQRNEFDLASGPLGQLVPRHDVGVVFGDGQQNHI